MKKTAINKIKKQLMEQRIELLRKNSNIEVDGQGDEVDALQAKQILSIAAQLSARDKTKLSQIDAALDRIDEGEYGACSECGEDINPKRLEAYPFLDTCIDCAEVLERLAKQEAAK